jgi:conjugative transfer signal peptidase TraF
MRGRFFERRSSHRKLRGIACLAQLFLWPLLAVYGAGMLGGVRLNVTPSVPIGLYQVSSDSKAAFVEFCPPTDFGPLSVQRGYRQHSTNCPDHGEPLLKPIIAQEGDTVAVSSKGISVNGALIPNTAAKGSDSLGRALTSWPDGLYRVAPGTVWVASPYTMGEVLTAVISDQSA